MASECQNMQQSASSATINPSSSQQDPVPTAPTSRGIHINIENYQAHRKGKMKSSVLNLIGAAANDDSQRGPLDGGLAISQNLKTEKSISSGSLKFTQL